MNTRKLKLLINCVEELGLGWKVLRRFLRDSHSGASVELEFC